MMHARYYSVPSDDKQRHRSNIARPSDRRSLHGSMPSKTTSGLHPIPNLAKDATTQVPSPTTIIYDTLDDHHCNSTDYSGIMHYSAPMDDFAPRQSHLPNSAPLYSQGSAFLEAAGQHGYNLVPSDVASYVCSPCTNTAGFDGIRLDNYNLSFHPVQGSGGNRGNNGRPGNRRTNNRTERPIIAAGDGGERPPPRQPSSGRVTSQSLRDNPERLQKKMTEMCLYVDKNGSFDKCPFGKECNFAHRKEDLKFRYTTLRLMESAGQIVNASTYLARPCMTFVMTGDCPFKSRCMALHDPVVEGPQNAWLPIATTKTNAKLIVDRLAAHRDSSVHQENPLINHSIWENCRPSQRGGVERGGVHNDVDDPLYFEQMWADTYALICNDCMFISGVENVKLPSQVITDLQKLCIVRLMHIDHAQFQANHYRDYIFSPTHSLHSELCMILQTRYFFLPDVIFTNANDIRCEDLVKEITVDLYHKLGASVETKNKVITAYEVAFAPKGDHFANVTIWFSPCPVFNLEQSQIKSIRRLKQKKKILIRNEHTHPNANGALISRTSSADFPYGITGIEPFVSMSPANDSEESHGFIMSVLEHRIDSMIAENCSSVNDAQSNKCRLKERKRELQLKFVSMNAFHTIWTWPKREGMENVTISTKAPPSNTMPYTPLKSDKTSTCMPVWNSFVKNIGGTEGRTNDFKHLTIFRTLGSGTPLESEPQPLPHILSNARNQLTPTKYCETWKEILLGEPADGVWDAAVRLHSKISPVTDTPNIRNVPLSTVPFVQA